tara:strand:+ start:10751 stop:11452 length:702 start_codon:yes stop_codon:yes gene_type:complete
MNTYFHQPIIILGGFLIDTSSYIEMVEQIKNRTNNKVLIVPVSKIDWLSTNWSFGWRIILDKVDKIVKELSKESSTNKVTLIGHSSGGMILRLYLSDLLFNQKIYNGKDYANCLITLGTPNQAKRATFLRKFVSSKLPGSFYSKDVNYISVAGELDLNGTIATKTSLRLSKSSYRALNGNGDVIGDGLVPRDSALLIGSKQVVMKETAHGKTFGKYWYGSKQKVEEWLNKSSA